jgi:ATP-dependent Clp protease ATP-binding subunit ClpB
MLPPPALGPETAYGARPLRRVSEKQLVDRLALALLKDEVRTGDAVLVDAVDGELVLETVGAAAAAPT